MGRQQLAQWHLVAVPGNSPGHLADLAVGTAVDLGHLAERPPQPEGVVVGDHRRARVRVALEDVGQDPVALIPGEVEVDVGRVAALGIEKALEQEPGAQRLHVGDAEAVAHHRVGDRAAAAVGGAVLHDVVHHEEVVGEVLDCDDGQLVLQPVAGDRRHRAVAPLGALPGQRPEPGQGVVGVRHPRRYRPSDRNPVSAPLGDLEAGPERLGAVGEVAGEVGGGAEPGVAGGKRGRGAGGQSRSNAESVVLFWPIATRSRWRDQSSGVGKHHRRRGD